MTHLLDQLEQNRILPRRELLALLAQYDSPEVSEALFERARAIRHRVFGRDVYIRGLIEFTNYCKNDCYYCGIRRGNSNADRYRLSRAQILDCCAKGHELGFRTFVLQGGEDPYYTDDLLVDIIQSIKRDFPDCAVTLSIGEKPRESLQRYYDAGADRYLLRHETADESHYRHLHPPAMRLSERLDCLRNLKEIGYQVGTGFMVGSPGQTDACLAQDLEFIHELQPHMVGIGPYLPHQDTPFHAEAAGSIQKTLFLIGVLRLMLPEALLPATTALGTADAMGREKGILSGANVVMPNLSPTDVRSKYLLYDNKICTGDEAAECRMCMERRMNAIGYRIAVTRGDHPSRSDTVPPDYHMSETQP